MRNNHNTELLRRELFSVEQLKRHAVKLAGQHKIDLRPGPDRLLPRLVDNARVLRTAYQVVTTAETPGQRPVSAETWLLDNYYLIEQQISLVRRHLPRKYSRQLPLLTDGLSAGYPRVYDLALELISHMDGRVDAENTTQFISSYQAVEPLLLGELWAFPIMLQLALLENLRRVGLLIANRREELNSATSWVERLLETAENQPSKLIQLLAEFADADVPLTATFVEEFYARIQNQEPALAFVQTWVEQKLLEQGSTITQLSEAAGRMAAANQLSIANSIGSLRFIGTMDWGNYVEQLSAVEQILREDPTGIHACQDFATRDWYRHVVEDMARGSSHSEISVARQAINFAQAGAEKLGINDRTAHVGYYLVGNGRQILEREVGCRLSLRLWLNRAGIHVRLGFYLGIISFFTAVATALFLLASGGFVPSELRSWFFAVTGLIIVSALAVSLMNNLVMMVIKPRALPRLDFSEGIPSAHRTMVIVPTLLRTQQEIDDLLEALEIRYLGNRDPQLFFALLTDFHDAGECILPGEEDLLVYARKAVEALNASYSGDRSGIFYLFHRPRVWNPHERVWMGYERKRGKLQHFNALLRGGAQEAFSDIIGDLSILETIKYVITLDTDTQLPRDAAHMLIGNIAHPLNRPIFDAEKGRIVEGYAILQPRATASLTSANRSRFTKMFAGESGIDPYTREVSDVYQDLFGEGTFIGKGIYDVDAFRQAVDGRLPENLILSHDLLESGYARSALVTDVELFEEFPAGYHIDASRRHRWIRGDWQIAGWLQPRVPGPGDSNGSKVKRESNPLSALSLWKIFDNLRRSLVPPSMLLLLIGGWLFGQAPVWFWTTLVAGVVCLPGLLSAGIDYISKPKERDWLVHLSLTNKSASRALVLALLQLVFLPYDAIICLDAILRSSVKMLFKRGGLLLWHMESYARRNARSTIIDFFIEMWIAPVLAVLSVVILWYTRSSELFFCVPIVLLWLVSPVIGWWISRPILPRPSDLTVKQIEFLRVLARQTWRYFADFVGPLNNWLPPDNFQEHPAQAIASRTSPTNIGMSLLADLAAYDFGYVCAGTFLRRVENTLSAMEKLERYHGHLYNWYDTKTLQPLLPRYVSSVDSGNLAGSLLVLQKGLVELKSQLIVPVTAFQGLRDTLRVVAEYLPASSAQDLARQIKFVQDELDLVIRQWPLPSLSAADNLLAKIQDTEGGLIALMPTGIDPEGDFYYWVQAFDQQLRELRGDIRCMAPSLHKFKNIPTLDKVAKTSVTGDETVASAALERLEVIDDLVGRCRDLAKMNYEFLYNRSRHLLAIGYDVDERRRDPSCYDLLASEARLASFLLIAEGQVPQKHWFSLGRLLTSQGGNVSLISWSGSMFEYLMPQLIMPNYDDTLLAQTCKAAVSRQIEYGRQRDVPWGISESCYNATDINQVYQYRAFGVPGLGLKRGLGDDLVISPYASALALTVMPLEACRNLQLLATKGFSGKYGFYEAIDYTPSRVPPGQKHAIVQTFMAHHQGMSLLAFEHILLNQPMQRRFISDPLVRATELLLQERVSKKGAVLHPHAAEVTASAHPPIAEGEMMRVFTNPNTPIPEVHLLSNGRYHVVANNAGGGFSRWQDLAITRWREDVSTDGWGTFIYLRDSDMDCYWSSAYQPTLSTADHYEAIFVQARAEYRRRDEAIETYTEISVSPEDDVEIRRVTLTNKSSLSRKIEITSYAEIVLAPHNADLSHRSFSNLFVQTEILPDKQAILCTRRPRTPGERVVWMFHLVAVPGAISDEPSYETDRAKFIGRGRTVVNPLAMDSTFGQKTLSGTDGPVLDPIVAIRRTVTIAPDGSANAHIISGVAETREAALIMLEKYSDRYSVERVFEIAWVQSQEVLRNIGATEADAQIYGRLATSVIYANALRRASSGILTRNQLGQSGLWRFAISGDLPIVLLRIGDRSRISLLKQVLNAHIYWRMKGLVADLVIINEDFSGYRAIMQDQIIGLINAGPEAPFVDKPGGVFVRRAEELSEEDRVLLQTVARIVFSDTIETIIEQVERRISPERVSDGFVPVRQLANEPVDALPDRERIFYNGLGGFTPDGREYVITLEPGESTPAPWANVIAGPFIGTVVSESGSAYTWVENAHEFRLTTWHNDPLSDTSGEAFYIRDEETGTFWSPTPLPAKGRSGYVCRHGFGYSVFEHSEAGITSEMYTYVAMDAPVKFVVVKLHNHSKRLRRLSISGYWELVLGEWRHANLMHVVTETDPHTGALFAHNLYGRECAGRVVFAQVSELSRSMTGNRTEFLGRNGTMANPAAMHRTHLSGRTGAGFDPCAALQTVIELADGEEREIVFVFGAARDTAEAQHLIQRFIGPAGARQALEAVWEYWNHTLGTVHVETPDPALDVLTNGWLIYQTLSCRLWGRSGYYQSGGAYGFRDQLQDTMALIHATPWLAREQLIRCAGRQFLQGDVQHWWHPPKGQGVRTHFSDDYLWLPYATCRYVLATGDTGVLDESVHFLEGRELNPDEEAYYDLPQKSHEAASLYEHCVRAIKYGLRFGEHQLPLIGCGDWNDGMNLIGREGKGESVWLGWFLYENLQRFAGLSRNRGDDAFAVVCVEQAEILLSNIEENGWDGEWYRRAYFDDGTPLGSSQNEECQIDSISQSWAIISGGGDPTRARQAMESLDKHLVRRDADIIQLLTPPFDKSDLEPGYIKGYVPGVRENGGQYTHAAIWATAAFAMIGDKKRAWELFAMLNPVNHGSRPEDIERYKVEPYVMCADIYGAPPHTGRGGWTWYTGASGWMYRLIVENLLGVQLEVDQLRIIPRIPTDWESYTVHYRHNETFYHITVKRVDDMSLENIGVTVDGVAVEGIGTVGTEHPQGIIPLVNDRGDHHVEVIFVDN